MPVGNLSNVSFMKILTGIATLASITLSNALVHLKPAPPRPLSLSLNSLQTICLVTC